MTEMIATSVERHSIKFGEGREPILGVWYIPSFQAAQLEVVLRNLREEMLDQIDGAQESKWKDVPLSTWIAEIESVLDKIWP